MRVLVAVGDSQKARTIAAQLDQLNIVSETAVSKAAAIQKFDQGDFQVVITDAIHADARSGNLVERLGQIAPGTLFLDYTAAAAGRSNLKGQPAGAIFGRLFESDAPTRFAQIVKSAADKSADLKHAAVRRGFSYAIFFSTLFWVILGVIYLLYRLLR